MNAAQYAEFHKYVPIMAHVWNTVTDSETGITPFQAEHGMPCRSIAESILQQPPAEGLPATADDLKSIAVSVHAFNEHISNVKAVEKAQTAIRLNASGNSRIHYQVGDQVGFYLPPDDKTAKAMGKKKKHDSRQTSYELHKPYRPCRRSCSSSHNPLFHSQRMYNEHMQRLH